MKRLLALFISAIVFMMDGLPASGQEQFCDDAPGGFNTATGTGALALNQDGCGNTAMGFTALGVNTDGHSNTAVGIAALLNNTTGSLNTATGRWALFRNTIADANTAIGAEAMVSNTIGTGNTAIGARALHENTSGIGNTATGDHALFSNVGNANTAHGAFALFENTTGNANTALGDSALFGNVSGRLNTGVGFLALDANRTGSRNTAVGADVLLRSTGDRNTAVGYRAGAALRSGSNNIYLGHAGNAAESATMRLGEAQTRTFITGVSTSAVNGTTVVITPGGRLGTRLSSARYKADIEGLAGRSEGVHRLRPVTFVYRDDENRVRQYGLLAEEVAAVYPELVTTTETGEVHGVRYEELIPLLLNELQQQQRVLRSQQIELTDLRARMDLMQAGASERLPGPTTGEER